MSRLITNCPIGLEVDHQNHNTIDNRRHNLRVGTHAENLHNRLPQEKTASKYKGVSWYKQQKKWGVRIKLNNKSIFLGLHRDEMVAAKAYDNAAKIYFGEFAYLNFH